MALQMAVNPPMLVEDGNREGRYARCSISRRPTSLFPPRNIFATVRPLFNFPTASLLYTRHMAL